jgi:hypothetical protein
MHEAHAGEAELGPCARNLFTLLVAYSQRGAAPVQLSETLLTQPCGRAASFSHLCAPRDALELQEGLITLRPPVCWCVVLASLYCTMRTNFCKKKVILLCTSVEKNMGFFEFISQELREARKSAIINYFGVRFLSTL